MRSAKRFGLRGEFGLLIGQELGVFGGLGGILRAVLQFVPGGRDDVLFALRDFLLVAAAHAAHSAAAGLLGLRIVALEGLGLDEVHVGLGGVASVVEPWHKRSPSRREKACSLRER